MPSFCEIVFGRPFFAPQPDSSNHVDVMALDHSVAEPSFVVQRIYFFYSNDDF